MTKRFIAGVLCTCILFSCWANGQTAEQLFGRWRVTKWVNAGPVTAINVEPERLVGHLLILTPHAVRFAGQTCHPQPAYSVSHETSAEFFEDSKVEAKTMNLPDPVTHFETGCTDIFIVKPNEVIFTWGGFFLQARKLPGNR